MTDDTRTPDSEPAADAPAEATKLAHQEALRRLPPEIGGPKGPEPTRFGDWEQKGRCTDF